MQQLQTCQQQGVVDVSESFGSVLHEDVINHARLFVARLDRYADLPGGLVLVALRTADFSTLERSKEQAWRPYSL